MVCFEGLVWVVIYDDGVVVVIIVFELSGCFKGVWVLIGFMGDCVEVFLLCWYFVTMYDF